MNPTVQEIRDKKKEVETKVAEIVKSFRAETGLAIMDIHVEYFSTYNDMYAHLRVDVSVEEL